MWLANLGAPAGRPIAYTRPVVIVKSDAIPIPDLTLVVPITSQTRRGNPAITVDIPSGEGGLDRDSLVLCHNVRVLDTAHLEQRLGSLPALYMSRIEMRLTQLLGLGTS